MHITADTIKWSVLRGTVQTRYSCGTFETVAPTESLKLVLENRI